MQLTFMRHFEMSHKGYTKLHMDSNNAQSKSNKNNFIWGL